MGFLYNINFTDAFACATYYKASTYAAQLTQCVNISCQHLILFVKVRLKAT